MAEVTPSVEAPAQNARQIERVNQLYRSYLNRIFDAEYYRERHRELLRYTGHFDASIGSGAALSGGSGLGIFADEQFAWICGALTTVSVIAAVVKTNYKFGERQTACLERVVFYHQVSADYRNLIDDVQAQRCWTPADEERFLTIRNKISGFPPFSFPHWREAKLRLLQKKIKTREKYESWWEFRR